MCETLELQADVNTHGTLKEVTASTNLNVTPKVTNEGSIIMKVDVSKESFGDPTDGS